MRGPLNSIPYSLIRTRISRALNLSCRCDFSRRRDIPPRESWATSCKKARSRREDAMLALAKDKCQRLARPQFRQPHPTLRLSVPRTGAPYRSTVVRKTEPAPFEWSASGSQPMLKVDLDFRISPQPSQMQEAHFMSFSSSIVLSYNADH